MDLKKNFGFGLIKCIGDGENVENYINAYIKENPDKAASVRPQMQDLQNDGSIRYHIPQKTRPGMPFQQFNFTGTQANLTGMGNDRYLKICDQSNKNTIPVLNIEPDKMTTTMENNNQKANKTEIGKLKWKGKPAHLALIIDLLIEKGYLEAAQPYGERTAEILLNLFDFEKHKPTKESLGKLLHKDSYPIKDQTAINLFKKMPNRSELK